MRILHIAAEIFPLVKTGGLADVAAALPPAQAALGADARILLPGYPAVLEALEEHRCVLEDANLFGGGPARLLAGRLRGVAVPAYVLDCPGHYMRPGNPYLGPDGHDWPDNHRRYAALGWAGARLAQAADGGWLPIVLHAHDWQAGLAHAYLTLWGGPRPLLVTTIHNIAYQGLFPASVLPELGLPGSTFVADGLEYWGQVGFLKAGLHYADRITTVSRTYATEIQTPEHGHGLDGLLRARAEDLAGIVNGVDYTIWDPARDAFLPRPYSAADLDGKASSKLELQRRIRLPEDLDCILFGVVSRLNRMKGLDLLAGALPTLMHCRGQLALLGSGDGDLEDAFTRAAKLWPDRIAVHLGYDEALAHLIQAGSDVVVVPSRSEPCGLTQLYALKYGSLPLVRRSGGLADTVVNATPEALAAGQATGFVFDDPSVDAIAGTISWVSGLWQDHDLWRRMQLTAMSRDFGWPAAARRYLEVYGGAPLAVAA